MSCRLEVVCHKTLPGQCVAAVGASPELGSWVPGHALRLSTCPDTFPVWVADVPQCILGTEFKFVILDPEDLVVEWEALDNNRCWCQEEAQGALEGAAALAAWFGRPGLELKPLESSAEAASTDDSASDDTAATPTKRASRCKFEPNVSCCEVPDLRELDPESKRAIWWRSTDLSENIRARVAMVRKYCKAAQSGATAPFASAVLHTVSCGDPDLERTARPSTIKAYVEAVLREQAVQRRLGFLVRDKFDRLAMVAREASATDLQYSISDAAKEAAQARMYLEEEADDFGC